MKMKAVVLSAPNDFKTEYIEKPVIGDDEILLKVKSTAICGTDMRILTGKKTRGVRYPSVIGHEICGEICEVGKNIENWKTDAVQPDERLRKIKQYESRGCVCRKHF